MRENDEVAAAAYDLVLAGGQIANADGTFPGTVAIQDGRIAAVWHADAIPDLIEATEVLDCSGRWVIPGGVDPHVHVGITFGDVQTPEDHLRCSRAALLGGTTTIVDFAIGRPDQSPLAAVDERLAGAREGSLADYALHGCYTDRDAEQLDQIPDLVDRGVRTIKVYTTYREQMMASDGLVRSIMERLMGFDGMTYVHAEDNSTIETLMAQLAGQGPIPYDKIRVARPEAAEVRAVRHVLEIAADVGAPVYFVHQSTPVASQLTRMARARGQLAYSEVCPHYVTLDESVYDAHAGECYTCCPPLRNKATVESLMRAVAAGHVDTIGSDHCAFGAAIKLERKHDLTRMPFGMPGVQTRVPLMLSELVCKRDVSMSTVVSLLSTNPARLCGLYPRKGVIAAGADADLLVWSPEGESTLTAAGLAHDSDYTPFEGWRVQGSLSTVIRRGTVMCRDGALVDDSPGQLLASGPISHTGPVALPGRQLSA
ncbi:amidohydrolase family protein [Nocardioides agariphilus]|uniref:Amidohydrolase family protein n=1 Tax=Nocardioides agariphilus TaxID=433664 RepID=A0A930VMF2_9ACTN|nr:amidohydrolase family protein [Nocardioides agariphilus]MBF4769352.1 amidohydrolase family protein [Nocardioides agariphilus]